MPLKDKDVPSDEKKYNRGMCKICEEECLIDDDYCCSADFCLSMDKFEKFIEKQEVLEKRIEGLEEWKRNHSHDNLYGGGYK